MKLLTNTKLHLYKPTENSNPGPLCRDDDWAANLLGLGLDRSAVAPGPEWGVEAALNAYLLDPMMSTMPLAYWQVHICVKFCPQIIFDGHFL